MLYEEKVETQITQNILEEWSTFFSFQEKLEEEKLDNKELILQGYGFVNEVMNSQFKSFLGYHLLQINNKLFAFYGESFNSNKPSENENLKFRGIVELNINNIPNQHLKILEAPLPISSKFYQYTNEDKILISKEGVRNIDLYISYHLNYLNKEFIIKIHPSVFSVSKHLAMINKLDNRINNLNK